jgi:hypothetical protein
VSTARYGEGYRARARYRDFDGVTRLVEQHTKTKGGAEKRLRLALRDRMRVDSGADLTAESKVSVLAECMVHRDQHEGSFAVHVAGVP